MGPVMGPVMGPAVATLAMLLLCWPVWWVAGILVQEAGLGELDLVLRVCLVFLALGAVERISARLKQPGLG